jgi:hypothetical protein
VGSIVRCTLDCIRALQATRPPTAGLVIRFRQAASAPTRILSPIKKFPFPQLSDKETRTSHCSPRYREPTIRSDACLAQIVHHALKRPIVGVFDQAVADWIVSDIQPFHIAGLIAPHLAIPKAPLPNRLILFFWPAP